LVSSSKLFLHKIGKSDANFPTNKLKTYTLGSKVSMASRTSSSVTSMTTESAEIRKERSLEKPFFSTMKVFSNVAFATVKLKLLSTIAPETIQKYKIQQ